MRYSHLRWILLLLLSCNQIEDGKSLDQKDIEYIRSLKLLDDGETIHKFYSEYKKKVAGNFFTDRRIATYWMDERSSSKNELNFAYYNDIVRIDTVYNAGLTYTPYMLVVKNDSVKFKVSVDGEKREVREFFEDALQEWKKNKK